MTNLTIILMVAVVSFVTCGILAVLIFAVDKNAGRRDTSDVSNPRRKS
jgi:hypothetical protein